MKKEHHQEQRAKTSQPQEGNAGHDNWIPDDKPFNFVENVIDGAIDTVTEYVSSTVGGALAGVLVVGAGKQVVGYAKGTKDVLLEKNPKSDKQSPNSTIDSSTNKNND